MTPEQVQAILHDFARRARLLHRPHDDGTESWRFDVDGRAYDLHYYPDDDTVLKRYVGGARAAREFTQLQAMQKLHVPAARVVANLKGFRIGERRGDATILVHDDRAVPLAVVFARPRDERLRATASFVTLLESLHRERLCPRPLTLDAFALRGDGTAIVRDGSLAFDGVVTIERLHELDAATRAVTSRGDRVRLWRHFTDAPFPRRDRAIATAARRLARDADHGEDDAFGSLLPIDRHGGLWRARYLRRAPLVLPWSAASRMTFSRDDWADRLPALFDATWPTLKDDEAATVRAGAIHIAGARLEVVVKRPAVKPGVRGAFDFFRPARVRRTWSKTWRMLGLGFRCEVPLLVLERRRGIALVDQLLVVERVPGPTLAEIDLSTLSPAAREHLLYASGRVLRAIVARGFTHRDAKATNWIAWTDPVDGVAKPVMIDLDGIRFLPVERRAGVERLKRAIRERDGTTEADADAVERGFQRRA